MSATIKKMCHPLDMETLGQRLRRLRDEKELTQVDVTAALPITVDRAHLAKIERDRGYPSYELLCALADFYNVSLDYLRLGATELEETRGVLQSPEEIALINNWRDMERDDRAAIVVLLGRLASAAVEKRA